MRIVSFIILSLFLLGAAAPPSKEVIPKGKYPVGTYSFGPFTRTTETKIVLRFDRKDVIDPKNQFSGRVEWFDGSVWRLLWLANQIPPVGTGPKDYTLSIIQIPPKTTQLRGTLEVTAGVVDTKVDVAIQ